jgi:hypothetical protein
MSLVRDPEFHPPAEKSTGPEPPLRTSPLAIVSLVFGILAYGPLVLLGAVVAVVAGHAARGQIREEPGRYGGRAVAKAGMILGYIQLGIVAAVLAAVGLMFVPAVRHAVHLDPFGLDAKTRFVLSTGVKMLNEMDRNDFGLIQQEELAAPDDEIIGCYVASGNPGDPELALLTTTELVYLNAGHVTRFGLNSIRQVTLPTTSNIYGPYEIEVERDSGARMRIRITPFDAGPTFGKAIEAAMKRAKGDSPATTTTVRAAPPH